MDVKEQTKKAYELFGSGDMETFFNDMIDDEIVWSVDRPLVAIARQVPHDDLVSGIDRLSI